MSFEKFINNKSSFLLVHKFYKVGKIRVCYKISFSSSFELDSLPTCKPTQKLLSVPMKSKDKMNLFRLFDKCLSNFIQLSH